MSCGHRQVPGKKVTEAILGLPGTGYYNAITVSSADGTTPVMMYLIDGLLTLWPQALNEAGEAWNAVQAASRAAELLPGSADVLMTLARAQLNLGEVSPRATCWY